MLFSPLILMFSDISAQQTNPFNTTDQIIEYQIFAINVVFIPEWPYYCLVIYRLSRPILSTPPSTSPSTSELGLRWVLWYRVPYEIFSIFFMQNFAKKTKMYDKFEQNQLAIFFFIGTAVLSFLYIFFIIFL